MKKLLYTLIILFCFVPVASGLDVIPGLKGFGTGTRAAYGNGINPTICVVTSLNPTAALGTSTRNGVTVATGGFRTFTEDVSGVNGLCTAANTPFDCCTKAAEGTCEDNKLIIFEVSGYIDCAWATTRIDNNYITIAGQTAPSPGVTLKRAIFYVREVHDVLIQHIASRPGDQDSSPSGDQRDALAIIEKDESPAAPTYNIVIDHCSFSWGVDENLSIWQYFGADGTGPHDVTIANSIISEALDESIHDEGRHSRGLISGANNENIAIIKNLFAHNYGRNPEVYNGSTYIANNVIYNGKDSPPLQIKAYVADMDITSIGNVIIKGSESTGTEMKKVFWVYPLNEGPAYTGEIYLNDSISEDDPDGALTGDSWDAVQDLGSLEGTFRVEAEPITVTGYTPLVSQDVEASVLANAGMRPANRGTVDARVVASVTARTGTFIDTITRTSANCTGSGTPMVCCTGLGTSDCVRNAEAGYPNDGSSTRSVIDIDFPSYPHSDDDADGYTNLEEWLHNLALQVESGLNNVSPSDGETGVSVTKVATWDSLYATDDVWLTQATCASLSATQCDGTPDSDNDADNSFDMTTIINGAVDTAFCLEFKANAGAEDCQQFDFTTTSGPPAVSTSFGSIVHSTEGGNILTK